MKHTTFPNDEPMRTDKKQNISSSYHHLSLCMWLLLVVSKAHARAQVSRWPGMSPFVISPRAFGALPDAAGGAWVWCKKIKLGDPP